MIEISEKGRKTMIYLAIFIGYICLSFTVFFTIILPAFMTGEIIIGIVAAMIYILLSIYVFKPFLSG